MGNFPSSVSDSSRPFFQKYETIGPAGADAIYIYPAVPVVPIPSDNDGSNPSYASATSAIYVYIAGVIQTGWTLAYNSSSNCSGSVNNSIEPRTATIGGVTADSGYAQFTATKGSVILTFRLYFSKVKAGIQGVTGATGSTGPTGSIGLTGAQGDPGTGLVILKRRITAQAGIVVTKEEETGALQINYPSDHNLSIGDYVWVEQSGVYSGGYPVLDVISTTSVKLWAAWNATAGTVTAYDPAYFRTLANGDNQVIALLNIIPYGAKILEWQLLFANDNAGAIDPFTVSIGDIAQLGLTTVDPTWLSGAYLSSVGDLLARDRRSKVEMRTEYVSPGDVTPSIYLNISPGGGNQWDSDMLNFELEFLVSYINYNPTYTP